MEYLRYMAEDSERWDETKEHESQTTREEELLRQTSSVAFWLRTLPDTLAPELRREWSRLRELPKDDLTLDAIQRLVDLEKLRGSRGRSRGIVRARRGSQEERERTPSEWTSGRRRLTARPSRCVQSAG